MNCRGAPVTIEQGLSVCYSLSSASVLPYSGLDFNVPAAEKALPDILKANALPVNGFFTGSSYKLRCILEINTECSHASVPSAEAEKIISEYISLCYDSEIAVKIIKGNGIDAESFDSL